MQYLTVEMVKTFDDLMNEHMRRHTISNNVNLWVCDDDCRRRAIYSLMNQVLNGGPWDE